jgi:hypothetical protein
VQKNAPNYGNFEDGNQLSFEYFRNYIKENNLNCDFDKDLLPKMKYQVALSLEAVISLSHHHPFFL